MKKNITSSEMNTIQFAIAGLLGMLFFLGLAGLSWQSFWETHNFFGNYRENIQRTALMLAFVFQYGQGPALFFARRAQTTGSKLAWYTVFVVFCVVDGWTNVDAYWKVAEREQHGDMQRFIMICVWVTAVFFEEIMADALAFAAHNLNEAIKGLGWEEIPALTWAANNANRVGTGLPFAQQGAQASAAMGFPMQQQQHGKPHQK